MVSSLLFMVSPVTWSLRNIISQDERSLTLILELRDDTAVFSWVIFKGFLKELCRLFLFLVPV